MIQDFPSFVEEAKQCFLKLYNEKTFWIHFDGLSADIHYKIPVVENFSYCLILLLTHHKDDVEEAFERLDQLLSYYVQGIGFPETLHDFPKVKSHHDQLIILKILKLIQEKYLKFADSQLNDKLLNTLDDLEKTIRGFEGSHVKKKALAFDHQTLDLSSFSSHDLGEFLLIKEVDQDSLKWYDIHTQASFGLKEFHDVYESKGCKTAYHLLAEFCLKSLDVKKTPLNLLRYLPLLQPKFWDHPYDLLNHQKALIKKDQSVTIIFKNDLSLSIESLHPIVFEDLDGRLIIKVQYPEDRLDEKESLLETKIFFSKNPSWSAFINRKKQTTFSLDHEVAIIDDKSHEVLSLSFKTSNGVFLGTLGFGNRKLQKKKTFTAYDQLIGIRTVTRDGHANLEIVLDYDSAWEPKRDGLSVASPMA